MQTLMGFLGMVGLCAHVLMFAEPAFAAAMGGAVSSIRLHVSDDRVVVRGIDGVPFAIGVLCVLVIAPLAVALAYSDDLSLSCATWIVALATGSAFGSRIKLHATAASAVLVRKILWVIPWRRIKLREPSAWVDGWGDMADPLALHMGERDRGVSVEVGWSLGATGRGDTLAPQIAEALRRLRR